MFVISCNFDANAKWKGYEPDDGVDDMTTMTLIDEQGINRNLRLRYDHDLIYVSTIETDVIFNFRIALRRRRMRNEKKSFPFDSIVIGSSAQKEMENRSLQSVPDNNWRYDRSGNPKPVCNRRCFLHCFRWMAASFSSSFFHVFWSDLPPVRFWLTYRMSHRFHLSSNQRWRSAGRIDQNWFEALFFERAFDQECKSGGLCDAKIRRRRLRESAESVRQTWRLDLPAIYGQIAMRDIGRVPMKRSSFGLRTWARRKMKKKERSGIWFDGRMNRAKLMEDCGLSAFAVWSKFDQNELAQRRRRRWRQGDAGWMGKGRPRLDEQMAAPDRLKHVEAARINQLAR